VVTDNQSCFRQPFKSSAMGATWIDFESASGLKRFYRVVVP
jgi:hypothetical protein